MDLRANLVKCASDNTRFVSSEMLDRVQDIQTAPQARTARQAGTRRSLARNPVRNVPHDTLSLLAQPHERSTCH